jgi:hypothetical protein
MSVERLDDSIRAYLESFFKRSFRDLRIHTGPLAAAASSMLNARAYTLGNHVVFGEYEYHPETPAGLWLLAHEVTHVIQQAPVHEYGAVAFDPLNSPLEAEADAAADAAVLGRPLPPISIDPASGARIVRRKAPARCPGAPEYVIISAGPEEIYLPANKVIEANYLGDHGDHAEAIFFNSSFKASEDLRLPRGAPNKRFGNYLLDKLRGISYQLRPDIIDFEDRSFYEIKTETTARKYPAKVRGQLNGYYKLTELIRQQYGVALEPSWNQDLASWKPIPILPLPGHGLDMFVCTAATDYRVWPSGLVLYDVRRKINDEEQLKRAVRSMHVVEADRDFSSVMPDRKALRAAVGDFNPYLPEFVMIAPLRMYQSWKSRARDEQVRRLYEVKLPPFLDTKTPIGQFHRIGWMIVGVAAGAYAAAVAGIILIEASAFGAAAATADAAAAGGGGAPIASLDLYRAMRASKEAAELAKAAGVLIVIGLSANARANHPEIREITAARLVPVEMFKPYKDKQAASNADDVPGDFLQTEETAKGKFGVGTTVLYDWEPHVIIARIQVEY